MTQVSHKLRKDPCRGYSSHFRNSQLREKVILCIFMLDLVLLLQFVRECCSASSTFLPDAASSGSMTSLHRTAWIGTAYIYICSMYCYMELKKCSCIHVIKSSMPMLSEKGTKSHCKQGQINLLSNMGALKMFWT